MTAPTHPPYEGFHEPAKRTHVAVARSLHAVELICSMDTKMDSLSL